LKTWKRDFYAIKKIKSSRKLKYSIIIRRLFVTRWSQDILRKEEEIFLKNVLRKKQVLAGRRRTQLQFPPKFDKRQEGSQEWKLMKEIRRMKVSDKYSKKEKVSYVVCRIAIRPIRRKKSLRSVECKSVQRQEMWRLTKSEESLLPEKMQDLKTKWSKWDSKIRAQARKVVQNNLHKSYSDQEI